MTVHSAARIFVFAAFCTATLIALAGWLVRTRRISPFHPLGRALRTISEPFTGPIERRLVRSGGNPLNAGWWLAIGTAVIGVLLLSLIDWAIQAGFELAAVSHGGLRAILALAIALLYDILIAALILRVIGSWIGVFGYSRWMRPAYVLTDWLVEPIRRVLPTVGAFDLSPLVAWLALWVLRQVLLSII
ncbi:MAG TPA: YggT family protein [Gemmatimonadales bacterium]|nr:YggT family protein [Gemmatimonadales bacterium]